MYQVLIVEDEDWIRRGIVQSIRWRELGMELAGEAENGARALQILERRPVDIVLTDMKMPVCDGQGLLREMKDRKLDCEVIVLSEYTDFAYTRQAIHARVAEYLLKPIDPRQLNEVLCSAAKRLTEKSLSRKRDADPYDAVFRTTIARTSQEQLETVCLRHQGAFRNRCVVISCIQPEISQSGTAGYQESLERLAAEAPYPTKVYPYHDDRNIICLFSLAACPYNAGAKLAYNNWLRLFFQNYKTMWGGDLRIGTGREVNEIARLRSGLDAALAALRFLHRGRGAIICCDSAQAHKNAPEEPVISEQQITELLARCKKEEASKLRQAIIGTLSRSEYVYLPAMRQVLIDFTLTLEKCSSRAGYAVNITTAIGENYIDRINRIEWMADADAFLSQVFDQVFRNIAAKRALTTADVVEEVIRRIETNYMDEINLMQISQQYHINYVHLSRQFKERTGETFIDFLLRVRMSRARELIENNGLSEKETAALVGYSNPYYFAASYRKYFHAGTQKEDAADGRA